MKEIFYEIVKKISSIHVGEIDIELNYVSWNGELPKYELRKWSEQGTKPLKGFTFSFSEMQVIIDVVKNLKDSYLNEGIYKEIETEKFTCKIYKVLKTLSANDKWIRIISIVDWGSGEKLDLRLWSSDYKAIGKGLSLSFEQAKELINNIERNQTSEKDQKDYQESELDPDLFI